MLIYIWVWPVWQVSARDQIKVLEAKCAKAESDMEEAVTGHSKMMREVVRQDELKKLVDEQVHRVCM